MQRYGWGFATTDPREAEAFLKMAGMGDVKFSEGDTLNVDASKDVVSGIEMLMKEEARRAREEMELDYGMDVSTLPRYERVEVETNDDVLSVNGNVTVCHELDVGVYIIDGDDKKLLVYDHYVHNIIMVKYQPDVKAEW